MINEIILLRLFRKKFNLNKSNKFIKNIISIDIIILLKQKCKFYRYVLSVAVIAAAYSLLGLPLVFYSIYKGKRFLPELDFYGDKVVFFN